MQDYLAHAKTHAKVHKSRQPTKQPTNQLCLHGRKGAFIDLNQAHMARTRQYRMAQIMVQTDCMQSKRYCINATHHENN